MGKFLDFQQLKEAFDFDDAIEFLGLKLNAENNQLRGKCPACNSGGARGLVITPGRGFYCFGSKKGGDQIALVAHVKGIGMREAAELVQAGTSTSTVPDKRPERTDNATKGLSPLDYLDPTHEDVEALGLTAEDAEKLGAGYANKGVLRGLIALPMRDEHGTLLGYFGAAEGRMGKLNFPNVVPFKKRA